MPDGDGHPTTPGPDATPVRQRRATLPWLLLAAGALLVLVARWASRPEQVAHLVLDRAGAALGLRITSAGSSEYRLRGGPVLVVHDLVATQPGESTPVLRAARVHLALPWSTLRSRGSELTVSRIELDAPQLDLPALQRWRASRPPSGPIRIPTLTDGLAIEHGRITAAGWTLDNLTVALPSLHPGRPVRATAAGQLRSGTTRLPFDLALALSRPAREAGLGAAGLIAVQTPGWQLPMRAQLSTRLRIADDGIHLDALRYGARARHIGGGRETPFVLGAAGAMHVGDGGALIAPLGLVVRGHDAIPTFVTHGRLAWRDALSLQLDGRLASWPSAWPALPDPLGHSRSPLPLSLGYTGPADLSGPAALELQRDATRFDARFRLPAILEWLDAAAQGSPLPPIDGHLSTPRLDMAGARLEGVEVEFSDDVDEPAARQP